MCGVGQGPDLTAADTHARGQLALIFKASIQSLSKVYESTAQKVGSRTGEDWSEELSISRYSMVGTDKVLAASQIADRWTDRDGVVWSLAIIDREQSKNAMTERITTLDDLLIRRVQQAKSETSKLSRLRLLKSALTALTEREALNSDLRVVSRSGRGISSPYALDDVVLMVGGAQRSLQLGVDISGEGSRKFKACLEEKLTAKGYNIDSGVDLDVMISGKVIAESTGKKGSKQTVKVRVELRLFDMSTNKAVKTITGSRVATRSTFDSAVSTGLVQLCKRKLPAMVKQIDKHFGGR